MKKLSVLLILLSLSLPQAAWSYFPVGECFNSHVNFGFGANMGFGSGGGCGNCGGGSFGLNGGVNGSLMVPTGYQFINPYSYYNNPFLSAGMQFNPFIGANGQFPGYFPGAGATARVGLNLGAATLPLLQLLTGGISINAGAGVFAGGGFNNFNRFPGQWNQPFFPGGSGGGSFPQPIPYGRTF